MKRLIFFPFAITALALMLVTSGCKKSDSSLSETWAWKGTTYTSTTCSTVLNTNANTESAQTLTVQNGANILQIIFYGGLPTTSQVDTVQPWGGPPTLNATGWINVNLVANGNTYQSTGGNGSNSTVNVTVSNGTVTVSATASNNVELLNVLSNSTDSSNVTFSVVQ